MKHTHLFLLVGLSVCGVAALGIWSTARAQTPPDDLIYELPLVPLHSSAASNDGGYYSIPLTVDLNGDGLVDLVSSVHDRIANGWSQIVYLNNGNGWDEVYSCERANLQSPWLGDCDWRN